ncbi:MAG: flippase activity-associated protein Agl23, partial [Dehalococcoidia bacterium]
MSVDAATTVGQARRLPEPLARIASFHFRVPSWEVVFYLALVAVAGLMRFWDLGTRAMHHDESLHAFFSMNLLGGFRHNPLMHGPLQFFGINAFSNVFGWSEVAARALAATLGTALVGMPFFLRGYMGRWGSMAASVLIAFSPTLLYFSRFARNDILMAVWTLALIICIWKYLDQGKARYLYLGAAFLSLSFATKENSYFTVIILVSFLFLLWLRQPFRSEVGEEGNRPSVGLVPLGLYHAYGRATRVLGKLGPYLVPSTLLFAIAAGWVLSAILWSLDIYDIFGRVDLTFSLASLGAGVGLYIAVLPWVPALKRPIGSLTGRLDRWWQRAPYTGRLRTFLRDGSLTGFSRPGAYWLLLLLLAVPLAAAAVGFLQGPLGLTLVNPNSLNGSNPDNKPGFPDGAPVGDVSLAVAVAVVIYLLVFTLALGLKWNWRRFLLSGVIFWGIFALFYTTLFTNPGQGLGSGLWQSLGYWIAQQDVRRGGQPWYYYGILSAAYEFLPLLLVLGGGAWYLATRGKGRDGTFWLVQGFLASISLLLLLSTFWMPTSTGYQLFIGGVFLAAAASLIAWYVVYIDQSFLRSRLVIADVALIVLLLLNWVLPRIVATWDPPVFSQIWDARNPLVAVVLGISIVLITFKSLSIEDRFTWFLVYWLGLSLVLYGLAAEKMPWLMVHIALPLAILGGKSLGRLVERVRWRPQPNLGWAMGIAGTLAVGLLT